MHYALLCCAADLRAARPKHSHAHFYPAFTSPCMLLKQDLAAGSRLPGIPDLLGRAQLLPLLQLCCGESSNHCPWPPDVPDVAAACLPAGCGQRQAQPYA